jgi:hypothetical protein
MLLQGCPGMRMKLTLNQGTPPAAGAKAPKAPMRAGSGGASPVLAASGGGNAQAAISRQTCATRKQTVKPIASGSTVATVVHFALRVSL